MDRAVAALQAGDGTGAAEQARAAFTGLAAAASGVPEAGLTAREVDARLRELGVQADLVTAVVSQLETLDGLRYGGSEVGVGEDAARLLDTLVASLKAKGKLR